MELEEEEAEEERRDGAGGEKGGVGQEDVGEKMRGRRER